MTQGEGGYPGRFAGDRSALLGELRESPSGSAWARRHAGLADLAWGEIVAECLAKFPSAQGLSVVATGSYGRSELCPHSDLDVSLLPGTEGEQTAEAVKWMYHRATAVFTEIGLRLAYTYRLPSDVDGLDMLSRTSLLDARFVAGDEGAYSVLVQASAEGFPTAEFVGSKLEERRRELAKHNATPLVVEPNLKLGAGGLKDHTLLAWLVAAIGGDAPRMDEAYETILMSRNLLHLAAGHQIDTLNRNRREEIAAVLGYQPREFGSILAGSLDANHGKYCQALSLVRTGTFPVAPGCRSVGGVLQVDAGTSAPHVAAAISIGTKLGLELPGRETEVTPDPTPRSIPALAAGEAVLRNLSACGVLDVLMPELAACRTLMPSDASHTYTVYEHTLQAVRTIDELCPNSPLGVIREGIGDWQAVTVALLLHDVGKSVEGRPHSESGEEMAGTACKRFGFNASRTEFVKWLVRNHLEMSKVIRLRDVMNAETAVEFARFIGDEARLDALTLLTWADVNAVSPLAWSPVQETFLLELHARTSQVLRQSSGDVDEEAVRRRLRRGLRDSLASAEEIEGFVDSMPPHYVLSTPPETARIHFGAHSKALEGETVVLFDDFADLGVTDVTVCALDSDGALTKMLGVLYALDLSVLGLRASTTKTSRPVLLDTFTVTSRGQCVSGRSRQRVTQMLCGVLGGQETLESAMFGGKKDPNRKQDDYELTVVDGSPMILEFHAPRGRGLAYRLARMIAGMGLNILAARFGQWAGSASASFYVEAKAGHAVDREALGRLADGRR